VDDETTIQRVLSDFLMLEGFVVDTEGSGEAALLRLGECRYDVIVSDLKLPGLDGVALVTQAMELNPRALTIVMTGNASVETAIEAMKAGAFDYILKPFRMDVVLATILQGLARREHADRRGELGPASGHASPGLRSRFRRAVDTLWLAFQPILSGDGREVFGHEVLLRSDEPQLRDPVQVLEAAELLGSLTELGRIVRERAVAAFEQLPSDNLLFVNLHPTDLMDPALFSPEEPLSRIASRVVLEITERSSLARWVDVSERAARLRQMGYRIALDDLGAGYSGLSTIAQLEPEIVKLDMSLVRDLHVHATKQKIVASVTQLARSIGAQVIAEGVECHEELRAAVELGCDFVQGFYFARPSRSVSPSPLHDLKAP
jgi:EAL domain-containing protein (putative c-di-GMP-specific phosphodiesterase class I)